MTAALRPAPDPRRTAVGVVVSIATGIALVGVAIALFFNPLWVNLEQARSHAESFTGWSLAETQAIGADVVREVWLGPGTFEQEVDGSPVFAPREQAHMADVRRVVLGFTVVVLASLAALLVTWWTSRPGGPPGRARWWRVVARGAGLTAVGSVVAGIAFALFFDQAFTLFHDVFFAAGTWTFDPRTDRLVQLFPDAFWTETTLVIAVVGLGLTIASWGHARHRAMLAEASADATGSAAAAGAAIGPGGADGR